ncbi:MAG: hybrid sensor histidine kinase/response regulator [Oculatellaceae cyanobacterium bins.114]|nr:hybrid sensor histidine kinase/response regulator [Oculatellaceae cyanobacterium bins.114]
MERRFCILVVDDETSMFEVIAALLYAEGYDLVHLTNGRETLNNLEQIKPDVILMDVMMPEMDGLEICRRIKSSAWKCVPIIMVTALTSKDDLARSLNAGADDFLTKPVSAVELRARVRSMLRIKQQYDALETALQLRNDLSNMIVHDLRNPLANILIASQMLLIQNSLEGKVLERVQLIQQAGNEMNSMINDLLLLAKMEAGMMVLNRVPTDLDRLIADVIHHSEAIATIKDIHLTKHVPQHTSQISVDPPLVQRLLENLLSNAIKFSPHHTTVMVRVEPIQLPTPDSTHRASVVIQVIDQGPGVSKELRHRIFNRYELGDRIAGTSQIGLGLTFCKMVAEAHGGHISVTDNTPQGSIFSVYL